MDEKDKRELEAMRQAVDRSLERCQRILGIFGRGGMPEDLPMIAAKVMADLRGAQEEVTQTREKLKNFHSLYEKAHGFANRNDQLEKENATLRELVEFLRECLNEIREVDAALAKTPTEPA